MECLDAQRREEPFRVEPDGGAHTTHKMRIHLRLIGGRDGKIDGILPLIGEDREVFAMAVPVPRNSVVHLDFRW